MGWWDVVVESVEGGAPRDGTERTLSVTLGRTLVNPDLIRQRGYEAITLFHNSKRC